VDVYFLDSSALIKRYVTETGSVWVTNLIEPATGNRIFIARITAVEVVSAIKRRERSGNLNATDANASLTQFRRELASNYRSVDISAKLISRAMNLAETHALRGYDAVQLAAALEIYDQSQSVGLSSPKLICADLALNVAAVAEGLRIGDPNDH
jgi:predicted nucleic acid-binding protein